MACTPGRIARVKVSFDGGQTYAELGRVVDGSISGNVDELECTSHDSPGVREYIPNFRDETMDVSIRWDEDSLTQRQVLDTVYPTPTSFKVKFMLEEQQGRLVFEADCFVTSYSPSGPLDDTASMDLSLRLSGTNLTTQL